VCMCAKSKDTKMAPGARAPMRAGDHAAGSGGHMASGLT